MHESLSVYYFPEWNSSGNTMAMVDTKYKFNYNQPIKIILLKLSVIL